MRRRVLWIASIATLLAAGAAGAIAHTALTTEAASEAVPAAEVKAGLGIEKSELTGEATSFKVKADTRIYAWTKVTGCADSAITVVFERSGTALARQELKVPRASYRTWAYRTFRAADGGTWTANILAADGKVLGSVAFTVEVEK